MLTYNQLKEQPREFLFMTGLTVTEFSAWMPIFSQTYHSVYSPLRTRKGKLRQRKIGGGSKARLRTLEDKLLFILMYYQTDPSQTTHGQLFDLCQSQTNLWIQRLQPILARTLAYVNQIPAHELHAFPLKGLGAKANGDFIRLRARGRRPRLLRLEQPNGMYHEPNDTYPPERYGSEPAQVVSIGFTGED